MTIDMILCNVDNCLDVKLKGRKNSNCISRSIKKLYKDTENPPMRRFRIRIVYYTTQATNLSFHRKSLSGAGFNR